VDLLRTTLLIKLEEGRRRLTRPLALNGDLTFQIAAVRRHGFAISRRDLSEVCGSFSLPSKKGVQGIPGACCNGDRALLSPSSALS
jgi:hypothetical protein